VVPDEEIAMEMPGLYDIPLWVDALAFVLLLSVAVEAGYRIGLRQRRASDSAEKATRGDVTLSAMLALLGLMLAFTYAFTLRDCTKTKFFKNKYI